MIYEERSYIPQYSILIRDVFEFWIYHCYWGSAEFQPFSRSHYRKTYARLLVTLCSRSCYVSGLQLDHDVKDFCQNPWDIMIMKQHICSHFVQGVICLQVAVRYQGFMPNLWDIMKMVRHISENLEELTLYTEAMTEGSIRIYDVASGNVEGRR